jgi:hypothetical protein
MIRNAMISSLTLMVLGPVLMTASPAARAGSTRVWVNQTFTDFDAGTPSGVLVTSAGRLVRGETAKRTGLTGVSMVFSMIEAGGSLYLGTGNKGEVWVVKGGRTRKLATLKGAVIVTSFAQGPSGTIYAGTLPEGRIYAISTATGAVKPFAQVKAKHVWGLVYHKATLFAATGPKGKLFAINRAGRARVYWDSKETHLQSMAVGPGGDLYVGTAPKAIVYRVLGRGRVRALHDFAGNEIRALASDGKRLFVAVNNIKPDRSSLMQFPTWNKPKGTKIKTKTKTSGRSKRKLKLPRLGAKLGSGGLFAVDANGSATQLHSVKKGYFTALELVRGQLYAAEGTRGRVISILADESAATAHDVKERQVLALSLGGKIRAFGTGDGAALYRVGGRGKTHYTSGAYDTTNVSRFGVISYRTSGRVTVQTRSGNTAVPNAGWSRWKAVTPKGNLGGFGRGLVRSPAGRYVQYRIGWPGGSKAVVHHVRLHFTAINRAPRWQHLKVGSASTGKTPVQKAGWIKKATSVAPKELKISWKVTDPDGDPLAYRVVFRAVGDVRWRKIGDKPLTTTSLKWRTDNLPDGWYEIRVTATDERANSVTRARSRHRISVPVLVDHNKPSFVGLRIRGNIATGLVRDSFSRITGIAYSVDGKNWFGVDAVDGNFDQEAERFNFRLPKLGRGVHTLLVRAHDAAGNTQVVKRSLRIR